MKPFMDDIPLTSQPISPISQERPPRADAVKNRTLLLEAAAQLFQENGVENVTMSDIAQAAGVGKGTLYRHFNHKTELCYALLDEDQRALQQATLDRLKRGNRPVENLLWFVEQAASFVWRNLDLLSVIGETSIDYIMLNRAHLWWQQTIFALLQRAGGQQSDTSTLRYQADTLYVMLSPTTLYFQRKQGRDLVVIVTGLHQLVEVFVQHGAKQHGAEQHGAEQHST